MAALLVCLLAAPTVQAGAKLKIDDESELDLGFRVQALYISTDRDLDKDGKWDSFDDFALRRGRLRLGAKINKHFSAFLQTETSSFVVDVKPVGTSPVNDVSVTKDSNTATVIDAYVNATYNTWSQFIMGINMAPASRQNVTSSGALMAIDRPGMNYKTLTWGGRSLSAFSTSTFTGSDSGLRGNNQVRDVGLTLFGSGDMTEKSHIKYYLGMYDGVQAAGKDSERTTARIQVNLWDAEPSYYNSSTYLGKKKTLGLGASYDDQSDVDVDVDYNFSEFDVFLEWPAGPGTVTAEGAWNKLDFDDAPGYLNAQGDGYFVQAGYYINKWQPWLEYEDWTSDDPTDVGSYNLYRVGVTYFAKGQNANIKLGFEKFESDTPLTVAGEDAIDTIVLGFYTTY